MAALRPARSATFAPAAMLRTGGEVEDPAVAVGPRGEVVAAWAQERGTGLEAPSELWVAVRAPGQPAFGEPVRVALPVPRLTTPIPSPSPKPTDLQAAVAAGGAAVVAWVLRVERNPNGGGPQYVQAISRPDGGAAFAPARTVSLRGSASGLDLDAGAGGRFALAWSDSAGRSRDEVAFSEKTPDGRWSAPRRVDRVAQGLFSPDVELLAGGEAVVAWLEIDRLRGGLTDPRSTVVRFAHRARAGAAFGAGTTISPRSITTPTLVVDRAGRRMVTWVRPTSYVEEEAEGETFTMTSGERVELAISTSPTRFAPAVRMSRGVVAISPSPFPNIERRVALAVAPNGRAVIGWGSEGIVARIRPTARAAFRAQSRLPETGFLIVPGPDNRFLTLFSDDLEPELRARDF